MGEILVVGSVALDSVKTLEGESRDALGGSAVYFALAARFFARIRLVGVVGKDFPAGHRGRLKSLGIALDGLQELPGKTFRWVGSYGRDLSAAKTLETRLNVFEHFRPALSSAQKGASVVFLANIDPELQWEVLSQMSGPRLVACDTMNYWIASKRPALKELLSKVDVFFVNEEEARKLTREHNLYGAARCLSGWGPSVVVVKKGEHGALLWCGGRAFPFPAYPVEDVKDPTGAGDAFAGGFLGFLSSCNRADDARNVKRAMVHGAVLASFNVQDFGTRVLEALDMESVQSRYREYLELLDVGQDVLVA